MAKEIEHKYLVTDPAPIIRSCPTPWTIQQGYISISSDCIIRLRLANWRTWHYKSTITIKSSNVGSIRDEWEFDINDWDAAQSLFQSKCQNTIIKKRYTVKYDNHTWEIDEFLGENNGLWLAEIELANELEHYSLPSWCGRNVTEDVRFYNSNLSVTPYRNFSMDLRD